jgi:SAM-dependent methyltransferase
VVADPRPAGAAVTKRVSQAVRIDADYYDRSEYFAAGHLRDLRSPFQRYRVEKVLSIYDPSPQERVLDLGCGWGTFEWELGSRVAEVVGVDFSAKSVELCERQRAVGGFTNVRFVHADGGDTGLAAGSFDLVIAADLFEHLYPDDSERVAHEAHRVLKSGGRFSIWTPHRGHVLEILKNNRVLLKPDPTHVDYKSMDCLRSLLARAGFTVEKAFYAESHLPGLRTVERALMGVLAPLRRRIALLGRKN